MQAKPGITVGVGEGREEVRDVRRVAVHHGGDVVDAVSHAWEQREAFR